LKLGFFLTRVQLQECKVEEDEEAVVKEQQDKVR
jgi:hypothetical protein